MFGSKKVVSERNDKQATATIPQPKPLSARATPPSIISQDLIVKGSLSSEGDIQIDGRVEGSVVCASLVVGEKAVIAGDVYAQQVMVRGAIEGNVRSKLAQFGATCRVTGDIFQQSFSIESGAQVSGYIRHSDNPLDVSATGASVVNMDRKTLAS
jgi:cytoskeletal protein CcmA (bactofilin family)